MIPSPTPRFTRNPGPLRGLDAEALLDGLFQPVPRAPQPAAPQPAAPKLAAPKPAAPKPAAPMPAAPERAAPGSAQAPAAAGVQP